MYHTSSPPPLDSELMGNSPSKKANNTKKGKRESTIINPPSSAPQPAHNEEKTHVQPAYTAPPRVEPPAKSHSRSESDNSNNSNKSSNTGSSIGFSGSPASGGAFSSKKLDELFDKYKDEDGQAIGPAGVEQLCKDINVDPEDILVLVFAWHLNAQRMGFFSKEEFVTGLQKLGVDNISKLKGQLGTFKKDLDDQVKFKDIYRFAFGFVKERETKIIDLPTADALLSLVLSNRYPHTEALRQFLKEQTTYKSINQDQWMNILEFSKSIKADLSNYDENSAWPVLLDEYSEWASKHKHLLTQP